MPNSREWAIVVWVAVVSAWVLSQRDSRASCWEIVRLVAMPKLLSPLLLMAAWVAGEVYVCSRFGWWEQSLTTASIGWYVAFALVSFVNLSDITKEPHFFNRTMRNALELGLILDIVTSVVVFHFAWEVFVIVPGVTVLAVLHAFTSTSNNATYYPIHRTCQALLALLGLSLVGYGAFQLAASWGTMSHVQLLRETLLPVWLTMGLIPYLYTLALIAEYGEAFRRIDWISADDPRRRRLMKGAIALEFGVHLYELGHFGGAWQVRLRETKSLSEARALIRGFRQELRLGRP